MFKVGDIVKVREDLEVGKEYGNLLFRNQMMKYLGKEVVIDRIVLKEGSNLIGVDNFMFWLSDEMLIPLSKAEDDEIPMVEKENDVNVVHPSHYNKEIEAVCDAIKPNHYNAGKFDVIWFCQYHNLPFDIGNIIKYAFRAGKKDKDKEVQDLEKAIEYANRRIEFIKGE